MEETTNKVDMLKEKLVLTMENVQVEEKNTDELILVVNAEAESAEKEQAIAQEQEALAVLRAERLQATFTGSL